MPSPTKHYAALILGSGQSGTPLASHLATLPQFPSVCIVERTHIAGCCVNEGCTPTKTMVASARVAHLARRAADYGVSAEGGEVQIDMQKVRQRKRDIVNSFRGGSERRLANAKGVDVVMGEAKFVGQKEVEIELNTKNDGENGKMAVSADSVFINVGCRPSRPAIPGLESVDQERVLDSTSVQELGEVPKHLVVVGGGYIGLEFGQLLRRLGAKVTIIHRGGKLLGKKDDPECVECMQGILRDEGVEILLNVSGSELSKSKDPELPITISTSTKAGENKELNASHILFATGRIPNTDTLNLSAAGIETTPSGHIHVSPTLATSVDGVYALGDVKGGPAFTHVSYDDFRIIRDNLAVQGTKTEGKVRTTTEKAAFVPSVVYTDPQFAHIGPKWGDLPKNQDLITYSMPGSWIARGLETDETKGMLKAVVDSQTNRIVSFSAICTEGGEVMAVVQIAMLAGMTWMQLREAVFAHPSWSESLNNVWGGERTEVRFE